MTVLRTLAIAGAGVLMLGTAACGDKTVTSSPDITTPTTLSTPVSAADSASSGGSSSATQDLSPTAVPDDAQLDDVDQMLRDIEADLNTADQEATTAEGDPTS